MTIRARGAWAAAVAIMVSMVWIGCVADEPAILGPGNVGQVCLPNGTCDQGLTCSNNICVAGNDASLDDGSNGGDGASGDGASKRDGSGGTDSGGVGPEALGCGSALFTGNASDGGVVSAPEVAAYNPTANFTVEAWIYPTAIPGTGLATIMAHEDPTTNIGHSWSFGIDHNGALNFVFSSDGSTANLKYATLSNPLVPLNQWSHVAGGYYNGVGGGGSETVVWLNGQNRAGGNPSSATINAPPTGTPLTIGNSSDGAQPFAGRIEEARYSNGFIYNLNAPGGGYFDADARLSPWTTTGFETLALFHLNDGAGGKVAHDSSSAANNATVAGDATLTGECEPGVCSWVHLPGGNATIDVAAPSPNVFNPPHDFTLEGWFRVNGDGNAVAHGGAYNLIVENPQGQFVFNLTCSNSSTAQIMTHAYYNSQFLWHHWAAELDTAGPTAMMFLYVDGVLAGSTPSGCTASQPQSVGLDFGTGQFDISEVRLSSSARYDGGTFSPEKTDIHFTSDGQTLALYHFDEGDGGVAHDSTGTFPDGGLNAFLNGNTTTPPSFARCQ